MEIATWHGVRRASEIPPWHGVRRAAASGTLLTFLFLSALLTTTTLPGLATAQGDPPLSPISDPAHWGGIIPDGPMRGASRFARVLGAAAWQDAWLVAGDFDQVNGVPSPYLAILREGGWEPFPSTETPLIRRFTVFDDRPVLAGIYGVVSWDGAEWRSIFTPPDSVRWYPNGLTGWNDRLIISGASYSRLPGAVLETRTLAWDGVSWEVLGSFGGKLFVHHGRLFSTAPLDAGALAMYEDGEWVPVGGGLNDHVAAWASLDEGLLVTGRFTEAGGAPAYGMALWDGTRWLSWLPPIISSHRVPRVVSFGGAAMVIYRESEIYLRRGEAWIPYESPFVGEFPIHAELSVIESGDPVLVGGYLAARKSPEFALWDETGIQRIPQVTLAPVQLSALFPDGDRLLASGEFVVGDRIQPVSGVASWDGATWSDLIQVDGRVWDLTRDRGSLVLAGEFSTVDGTPCRNIAVQGQNGWKSLGGGSNGTVYTLGEYEGELHAGGQFTEIGGAGAARIARWDGRVWSPLGAGIRGVQSSYVGALTVYGRELYAAGWYTWAGQVPADAVARWDGRQWRQLGGHPLFAAPWRPSLIQKLIPWRGRILANGPFQGIQGIATEDIAAWDGVSWSGFTPPTDRVFTVFRMADFLFVSPGSDESRSYYGATDGMGWYPVDVFGQVRDAAYWKGKWYVVGDLERAPSGPVRGLAWWTPSPGGASPSPVAVTAAPNPVHDRTTVHLSVDGPGRVTVEVFDVRGRRLDKIFDEILPGGDNEFGWDGMAEGRRLTAGVYFLRIRTPGGEGVRRVVLLR